MSSQVLELETPDRAQPTAPCPPTAAAPSAAGPSVGESLAGSVLLMLILMAGQRVIGFVRGVLFCRWLEPDQLGQWDLALAFLTMAAPLAVLGIPGSFGRYVEHFRGKGQLGGFLRQAGRTCLALAFLAVALLLCRLDWVSQWVFGSRQELLLCAVMALGLAAVIAFNYLNDLCTALRRFRLASLLQLLHAVAFAVVGTLLAVCWQPSAVAVAAAYGAACLLACGAAMVSLQRTWPETAPDLAPLAARSLWAKLAPFAAWMWVTNALWNLFSVVDRYMIVHCSNLPAEEALALAGNYHSSRVVPLLLASVAATVAGVALPHLSHHWEAGRREMVSKQVNLILKVLGSGLTAGGVLLLWGAPLLFGVALEGKYAAGEAVLPWTLVYCIWAGLSVIAHNYLWCAERAGLGSLALFAGLLVNVGLNLWLAPRYGLPGVVWATAVANLLSLVVTLLFCHWRGLRPSCGAWLAAALPLSLWLGKEGSLAMLLCAALGAAMGNWLFDPQEKRDLLQFAYGYWRKARHLLRPARSA